MEISGTTQTRIATIAERYGLDLVVCFGSTARGRTHRRSDLDVAVRAARPLGYRREAAVREELCAAFGRSDVDARDLRTLPASLLRSIARDGAVCYERERGAFARFQMYASQRFAESAPLRALRRARVRRHLGYARP